MPTKRRQEIQRESLSQPQPEQMLIVKPLGVSYSGATYKFTVLDTLGRRVAQQGQLSHTPIRQCS
jgi:hypothetical protein